jgi:hypothetical protein
MRLESKHKSIYIYIYIYFFFFCSTGVWTQVNPLHQPLPPFLYIYLHCLCHIPPYPVLFLCVCEGFFQDRVFRTICLGWLRTMIFLISVPWIAGITGMSTGPQALYFIWTLCTGWGWFYTIICSNFVGETKSHGILVWIWSVPQKWHACRKLGPLLVLEPLSRGGGCNWLVDSSTMDSQLAALWRRWEVLGWGFTGGRTWLAGVSWGNALSQAPLWLSLLPGHSEVLLHMLLPHQGHSGASQPWPETSETMSQNKSFSLLSGLCQAFSHRDEKSE